VLSPDKLELRFVNIPLDKSETQEYSEAYKAHFDGFNAEDFNDLHYNSSIGKRTIFKLYKRIKVNSGKFINGSVQGKLWIYCMEIEQVEQEEEERTRTTTDKKKSEVKFRFEDYM
jgi:hypothetical protein